MTRVVKDIINFNKTNFNTTAETETLCVLFLFHVARFQQIDFCAQFLAARKIFDWFFMFIITSLFLSLIGSTLVTTIFLCPKTKPIKKIILISFLC